MKLKTNPYLVSLSFYPEYDECYLHVKGLAKQQHAITFLQQHNIHVAQSNRINDSGVIRIVGQEHIHKLIQLFDANNWLVRVDDKQSDLDDQFSLEEEYKIQTTCESLALTAAKVGDYLILRAMLGDGVTESETLALANAREVSYSNREEEYAGEFEREALFNQIELINSYLALTEDKRDIQGLFRELNQCVRESREVIMAAKLVYYGDSIPLLYKREMTSFEEYEQCLRAILDERQQQCIEMNQNVNLNDLLKMMRERFQQVSNRVNELAEMKMQASEAYVAIESKINRKRMVYSRLLDKFLEERYVLPDVLQYQDEAERIRIKSRLMRANVYVDTCDYEGNTLFHYAMKRLDEFMLNLLLQYGANIHLENFHGLSPCEFAGINKSAILIEKGDNGESKLKIRSQFMRQVWQLIQDWSGKLNNRSESSVLTVFFKDKFKFSENKVQVLDKLLSHLLKTFNEAVQLNDEKRILDVINNGLSTSHWFYEPFRDAVNRLLRNPEYGLYCIGRPECLARSQIRASR